MITQRRSGSGMKPSLAQGKAKAGKCITQRAAEERGLVCVHGKDDRIGAADQPPNRRVIETFSMEILVMGD
jgi:hypothetical protein